MNKNLANMTKEDVNLSVFSEKQQDAIIGWMLTDRHFFISCIMHLEHGYFTHPLNGDIFKVMKEFHTSFDRKPSSEEVKGRFNIIHHETFRRYHDRVDMCVSTMTDFGLDALSQQMTGWMKTIKFASGVQQATKLYNSRDFSEAVRWMEKKLVEIRNTSFEDDDKVVFNDTETFFSARNESFDDCLSIGHPDFDALLREGAKIENPNLASNNPKDWTKGGLVKGDTTIILGPSNAGKTTTLTSIIIPNILAGKYILYFTHEQKWEDIKTKLFMNACQSTIEDLRLASPERKRAMKIIEEKLTEYLVYIPWIKAGDMWVESVLNEITLQQEILKSTKNRYFDMLVDDYPGKLKSKDMKGRAHWEELDYVYDQFVNSAMQWRYHSILPVQTNREGYKVNRGDAADSRVIDQADAAGSFAIMQKADNVITLNRSPKEQAAGYMRFYISKSRSASAQTTFATKTAFDKSRTHGPRLPAISIASNDKNSSQDAMVVIETMIANKKGGIANTISAGIANPVGGYPAAIPVNVEPEVEVSANPNTPEAIINPALIKKVTKSKK